MPYQSKKIEKKSKKNRKKNRIKIKKVETIDKLMIIINKIGHGDRRTGHRAKERRLQHELGRKITCIENNLITTLIKLESRRGKGYRMKLDTTFKYCEI